MITWVGAVFVLFAILFAGFIVPTVQANSGDDLGNPTSSEAPSSESLSTTKNVLLTRGETVPADDQVPGEWIVEWDAAPSADPAYDVIDYDEQSHIGRIRARPGHEADIANHLEADPNVVRYQPNVKVRLSTAGSVSRAADVSSVKPAEQWYFSRLHVPEAQRITKGKDVTIAVIDTGVALDHPDLKERLVSGINLLAEDRSPYDDNGHGTAVAGILAADGHVRGIAPEARIMPVKALDALGSGNSYTVARGIREAIGKGARVIVLSLTDPVYSFAMENALDEAERAGAVVVAAAGNDGGKVPYPAAYPTVLGVGALDEKDHPAPFSNRGDAVDVVAYGVNIFTARPGGYDAYTGTSMAAPQAAGVAALLLSKKSGPPEAVRDQLRTTASLVPGAPRSSAGFGRVDAYAALSTWQGGPVSPYGGNTAPNRAAPLPLDKAVGVALPAGGSAYFTIDAPYTGSVTFSTEGLTGSLRFETLDSQGRVSRVANLTGGGSVTVSVPRGRSTIRLTNGAKAAMQFTLRPRFTIYTAPYGDNSSPARAYPIDLSETPSLVGTLPRAGIEAWFRLDLPSDGRLTVRAETDDPGLDLVLMVQDATSSLRVTDDNGLFNGRLYEETTFDVRGGSSIRVGVRNFYQYGVNAEYRLSLDYRPPASAGSDRPDTFAKSAALQLNATAFGYIPRAGGNEYYHVYVDRPTYVRVDVRGLPQASGGVLEAYDGNQKVIESFAVPESGTLTHVFALQGGLNYIRLGSSKPFTDRFYSLKAVRADGPFTDVADHWAKAQLAVLKQRGVVSGYADGAFYPDRAIRRSEFITLLVRRLWPLPAGGTSPSFSDLPPSHWAYQAFAQAAAAGWVSGYPDGGIHPDAPITRAEMAAILQKALLAQPVKGINPRSVSDLAAEAYRDVSPDHWALPALSLLTNAKRMSGYPDGTLRPDRTATRAEAAALIAGLWP
ncbi:MAG: serine alkaline protease (subtilisin E) [Candidatus Carbobacillus altaicus]|uniref:Serine alkaline protease (Subtilisin E) n=1 Tax=Candidatus Carbonibacillus altaicus TaxID=2163959 RepID=A0A2R6Y0N7_9BACL|nr:MAG: serine alkaline protease (subtilisin E) [Candidatus Carbobacillus altaicus]